MQGGALAQPSLLRPSHLARCMMEAPTCLSSAAAAPWTTIFMQPRWSTGWARCAPCPVRIVVGGHASECCCGFKPIPSHFVACPLPSSPAQYFVWERPPVGVGGSQPATCDVVSPEKKRDKNICSVKVADQASAGCRLPCRSGGACAGVVCSANSSPSRSAGAARRHHVQLRLSCGCLNLMC